MATLSMSDPLPLADALEALAFKECPVQVTLEMIGKKWTILILRELFRGFSRFNRLLENVMGINPRTLSQRLQELQDLGLVRKRVLSETPVQVTYELTDLGKGVAPILFSLAEWCMTYLPERVFRDGLPRSRQRVHQEIREFLGGGSDGGNARLA